MLYSHRSVFISVEEAIAHIAAVATNCGLGTAEQDFLRAACDGAIEVWGTEVLGQHVLIPRSRWHTSSLKRWASGLALEGGRFDFGSYTDLEVRRADAERLWPRPAADPDASERLTPTRATEITLDRGDWERHRSRIAATTQQGGASGEPALADMGEPRPLTHLESDQAPARTSTPRPRMPYAEVRKWYEGTYIPECQTAGKQPSEAMDWAEAKLKFGIKVRRDQLRDLRRTLAPDDWRMQGRRPISKTSAENSAK